MVGAYVSQVVKVPANTYFAVKFDVSARRGYNGAYQAYFAPNLQVLCNAAGNTGIHATSTSLLL